MRVPKEWEGQVNGLLDEMASASGATVFDWHRVSEGHDEWFLDDGVHLTPEGRLAFAGALATAIQG